MSVMMFSEALSAAHAQDLLGMEREQMGGDGRNMTKECMAIKTGMLLNYADEPCSKLLDSVSRRRYEFF